MADRRLSPAQRIEDWLTCLKENGYKMTAPRQAVIAILAEAQRVLSPQEVYAQARQRYPNLGLVTVYRTIEKLEQLELIQRVHQPTGCQGFTLAFDGHQHLLICQECGQVEFFRGEHDQVDALIQELARARGFQIQGHWLQLFGLCASCQSRAGN